MSRSILLISVALFTFGAKLSKIVLQYLDHFPDERVAVAAAVLGVVGFGGIALAVWSIKRIRAQYDGMSYLAAALAVLVVMILVIETLVSAVLDGFTAVMLHSLAVFSWDGLLVLGFALFAVTLLSVRLKGWRWLAASAVYLVGWALMTVVAVDLVYFLHAGTNVGWHVLHSLLQDYPSFVEGEITVVQIALLSLPLVVIAVSLAYQKTRKSPASVNRPMSGDVVIWLVALGATFLFSALLIKDRFVTDISRPLISNPVIEIVGDALGVHGEDPAEPDM
jgi:hypothetical protein